jgi:hypothetical protein
MNKSIAAVFLVGMSFSGLAIADCEHNLSAEEVINCINYEGATYNTHSYSDTEVENIYSSSSKPETADKSEMASAYTTD